MLAIRGEGQVFAAVVVKYFSSWIISKGARKEKNQVSLRFDKKARLISNGTQTTIFVKYPIFRKAQPFFFRVLQIITNKFNCTVL